MAEQAPGGRGEAIGDAVNAVAREMKRAGAPPGSAGRSLPRRGF